MQARIIILVGWPRSKIMVVSIELQGGLYPYLISKVDGFRSFVGAPETERFNLVLLGGW